ncbi:hypothetical protein [Ileibacterium valens]|uniref:hypothetical protein n=1 Tax=Ileibacterium valens TaxID=1862668 RepID=UPI0027306E90|nr:hypothetical protein [Ileibacterium valens]
MEKIKIEQLMSGDKEIKEIEFIREYVPISEKFEIGRAIADQVYVDGEKDNLVLIKLATISIVVSYTNVEVEIPADDVYDFIASHHMLEVLPEDSLIYMNVINDCVEEAVINDSVNKSIRNGVDRMTRSVNRLLNATTKAIERMDVNKTGERIGLILVKAIEKMPDFNNIETLNKLTDTIKYMKG